MRNLSLIFKTPELGSGVLRLKRTHRAVSCRTIHIHLFHLCVKDSIASVTIISVPSSIVTPVPSSGIQQNYILCLCTISAFQRFLEPNYSVKLTLAFIQLTKIVNENPFLSTRSCFIELSIDGKIILYFNIKLMILLMLKLNLSKQELLCSQKRWMRTFWEHLKII